MNLKISDSKLPDYIHISIDKYPTPANFELLVEKIFSLPVWKSGLNVIIHITEENKHNHSLDDVYLYEKIISRHLDKLKKSHCAVVLKDLYNPEIHDIFKMIIHHKSDKKIRLFCTENEAAAWITEIINKTVGTH